MRRILLGAAALNVALLLLFFLMLFFNELFPVAVVSWIGVLAAAAVAVLLTWLSRGVTMLATGLLGSVAALIGWGSWLYFWWTDPIGPVINLSGFLGPVAAIALFTVSALLPSPRSRPGWHR